MTEFLNIMLPGFMAGGFFGCLMWLRDIDKRLKYLERPYSDCKFTVPYTDVERSVVQGGTKVPLATSDTDEAIVTAHIRTSYKK